MSFCTCGKFEGFTGTVHDDMLCMQFSQTTEKGKSTHKIVYLYAKLCYCSTLVCSLVIGRIYRLDYDVYPGTNVIHNIQYELIVKRKRKH
jgi:hypothetical protein